MYQKAVNKIILVLKLPGYLGLHGIDHGIYEV